MVSSARATIRYPPNPVRTRLPPMSQNLLASETSPYLLQHQHNPVHWRPWGPAALAEAEATGKPILLSVGYAACHWCHVMAHESFEDAADRGGHEPPLRQHQGRSRGAPRHRPDLHGRAPRPRRAGRLAADHVPDAGGRTDLGRHLFPENRGATAGRPSPTFSRKSRGSIARSRTRSRRTAPTS